MAFKTKDPCYTQKVSTAGYLHLILKHSVNPSDILRERQIEFRIWPKWKHVNETQYLTSETHGKLQVVSTNEEDLRPPVFNSTKWRQFQRI